MRVWASILVLVVGALWTSTTVPTFAQEVREADEIVRGLVPIAGEAKPAKRRAIDLDIRFEFDSARLTTWARRQLDELGKALKSAALAITKIQINGHTDAKGSAKYNKVLSTRRANSVKDYLVRILGIDPQRLVAVGRGEERLKESADPQGARNRRVEIVNLSEFEPVTLPVEPRSKKPERGGIQPITR